MNTLWIWSYQFICSYIVINKSIVSKLQTKCTRFTLYRRSAQASQALVVYSYVHVHVLNNLCTFLCIVLSDSLNSFNLFCTNSRFSVRLVFVSEHKDANTTSCMTYLDDAIMCALLYILSKSALPFRISKVDATL